MTDYASFNDELRECHSGLDPESRKKNKHYIHIASEFFIIPWRGSMETIIPLSLYNLHK